MITGTTQIIAHMGYPTDSFKAPMIYNPYFKENGIDVIVVPMGCRKEHYPEFLDAVSRLSNFVGGLVTMPHKMTTVKYLDKASIAVQISGSCNAVRRDADGMLVGDMFDGEGFVRSVRRKGRNLEGARALIIGSGGVGSAIAASMAKAGVSELGLIDLNPDQVKRLGSRLTQHYSQIKIDYTASDLTDWDVIVNATPLGMNAQDSLPFDVNKIKPTTFVGDVVMTKKITPFLQAALDCGCEIQVGTDMLYEQIPAYLEFFGLPSTTPDILRNVSLI
jgi:shikimate dehydrogenase